MTIEMRDAVNGDGLFDVLGKMFHAIGTLNTALATTVPNEVEDVLEQFKNVAGGDFELQAAIDSIATDARSWQDGGVSLATTIASAADSYLTEIVKDDSGTPEADTEDCLDYLIDQMKTDGYYVDANAVTLTLAEDPDAIGNVGDVAILYSDRRGDGREQENAIAEVIDIEVTSDGSATNPGLTFSGEREPGGLLSWDWPQGSGATVLVTATDPASSLLSNGDFEDTAVTDWPDDWIIAEGAPGRTIHVTMPEVQTVTVSGSPSGGSYTLEWIDAESTQRSTDPVAYNAAASTVQSALREIPGLETVEVSASGTSPDYTHTVTFTGVAGNVSQLTSTNLTVGGTIAHATTRAGDDGAYKGRALCITGDGEEHTTLYHALELDEETVYFCHLRARAAFGEEQSSSSSSQSSNSSSSVSSESSLSSSSTSSQSGSASSASSASTSSSSSQTGSSSSSSSQTESESTASSSSSSSRSSASTSSSSSSSASVSESSSSSSSSSQAGEEIRIEIVEAIAGGATVDAAGHENSLKIDVAALPVDDHESLFFSFRLKRDVVQPVYLKVYAPWGLADGTAVYLDEVVVVKATEFYDSGPLVGAVSGKTAAVVEDNWTLTVANDRAGTLQEWFHRAFDMAGKGLLLPVSGTTLIPDTVVG